MEIKTIDALLKCVNKDMLWGINKSTPQDELLLITQAINAGLLYKHNEQCVKLTEKGFNVIKSKLSWEQYEQLEAAKEFGRAQNFYAGNVIANAATRKSGRRTSNPLISRQHGEPILLPVSPKESKSMLRRFLDFQNSDKVNKILSFWGTIIAILATLIGGIMYLMEKYKFLS